MPRPEEGGHRGDRPLLTGIALLDPPGLHRPLDTQRPGRLHLARKLRNSVPDDRIHPLPASQAIEPLPLLPGAGGERCRRQRPAPQGRPQECQQKCMRLFHPLLETF